MAQKQLVTSESAPDRGAETEQQLVTGDPAPNSCAATEIATYTVPVLSPRHPDVD